MNEFNFESKKTNRYYLLGEISESTKDIWFVLHGYGQLGRYFIRHFRGLENQSRVFVAPEGSHHFYLSGTEGRVGASWMTKENRLADIADYCQYLNSLKKLLIAENKKARVHILGFSQGVATAFRWTDSYIGNDLQSLHAWAGTFPPDIDYNLNREKFNALKITASFGSDDEYISPENANRLESEITGQGIDLVRLDYIGGHSFHKETLQKVIETGEL